MTSYWKAMQGTVDKEKIAKSIDNTLCGSPEKIAEQIRENYHPDDALCFGLILIIMTTKG